MAYCLPHVHGLALLIVGCWPHFKFLSTLKDSIMVHRILASFFMVIFLAGLAAVPVEVIEAARIDGAGRWQLFWQIQWPMLREVTGAPRGGK